MILWLVVSTLLLEPITADLLLMRHQTAEGGRQSRSATSTDYIAHYCHDVTRPLAFRACGADTATGGNPGPRDPATPMNLILQCSEGESLICSAPGDNITAMCCDGVLPQGFSPQCLVIVRVFNGGASTTTLVTGQVDAFEPTADDIERLPHAPMTPPNLPKPPPDQIRPFLTSIASFRPITVPFHDRHSVMKDLNFFFCGHNGVVSVGVSGTSLSSESEAYICEKEMGERCGPQLNHGSDNIVAVFHSIPTKTLEYGREYFIRVFSYGHDGVNATIDVAVANTVVPPPAFVMDQYRKNALALAAR